MTQNRMFLFISFVLWGLVVPISLAICTLVDSKSAKLEAMESLSTAISNYHETLFAELVTTNLVSVPCNCGHCRPSEGIVIPEHIGVVGYDLKVVVSTQYLPIVRR